MTDIPSDTGIIGEILGGPPPILAGIPKITFDYFDLGEIPDFILCNPDKKELYSLGGISERTLSVKFNALSEVSFRADQYIDDIKMEYYSFLVNKRLINVISSGESVGYFMITDVKETDDGIAKYKEITAQSLEIEMASKKLVAYMSGSGLTDADGKTIYEPVPVTLAHLLDDLIDGIDTSGSKTYIPGWTRTQLIPGQTAPYPEYDTIGNRSRSFDISEKTVYDFLMTDLEREYGCVFHFDTVNKEILVFSPEWAITPTDIFISHNNLIKELSIQEVTDELATSLNVIGGNSLDIRYINPLGNNNIYRFNYFKNTDWMSQSLISAIDAWENKIISSSATYCFYTKTMLDKTDEEQHYNTLVEISSGSLAALETKLQVLTDNGQDTTEVEHQIEIVEEELQENTTLRDLAHQSVLSYQTLAKNIVNNVSLTNTANFTQNQYLELQPFIIESSFVDDNITITSLTSNSSVYEKADRLYRSASAVLLKMSEPKYIFEVDLVNFMQIKEFQVFRDQISIGAEITVELEEGNAISVILLQMDMNFDDPNDFKMVFGNRLRMDDESFKFSDLMNRAIDSGNSNKVYSQQWNTWTRNYQNNVIQTIEPIDTTDGLAHDAPAPDVFGKGYKEGVYINTGNFVNIVTPSLLWNGYPIGSAGGGGALEGPGIDINGITVGLGGDSILLYSGNVPVREFATVTEALAAANSGNVVILPPGIFTEDIVIPDGVSITGTGNKSIIAGSAIFGNGSIGTCINFQPDRDTSQEVYGIKGPTSGVAGLFDVWVYITNIGGGHTYGVLVDDGDIGFRHGGITVYSYDSGNAIGIYQKQFFGGTAYSHNNTVYGIANGSGKGHAFATSGQGDIYVTAGFVSTTTSPIGEI